MTSQLPEMTVQGLHEALASKLTAVPRDSSVLDVGCGSGAWLQRLRQSGFSSLTGVDWNADSVCSEGIRFVNCDLETGVLGVDASETFDLITCIEVVEHVLNTGLLLNSLATHLRPGGRLLVTTPNVASATSRARFFLSGKLPQFDSRSDPTHYTPFLPHILGRLLSQRGLRIVETWSYPEANPGPSFRRVTRLLGRLAARFLPDDLPGDVVCVLAERR